MNVIIVQVFDTAFATVAKQLPRLAKLGVTHVLVSPPQKSHSSRSWWGRYQPVDFTRVDGPLGNENDLYSLCQAAKQRGMAIVADTVIHHLSNESRYIHIRGRRVLWAQYPRFCANDLVGLHQLGRGRGLPILDTNSAWVRGELKNYLRFLFELGIRGFRFDSAKHLDPDLFPYLLDGLPPLLNFGELVYTRVEDYPEKYWRSMRAYDFPLANSMHQAFAFGGDLGQLLAPEALWGPHSIPFVNHHDLARNRKGFSQFRIPDLRDRKLAYAYLLSRAEGTPLVYGPDLRYREVKAGLHFHRLCRGLDSKPLAATREVIVIKRGDRALVGINKGGEPYSLQAIVDPGRYRDLVTGWEGTTSRGRLHWLLPGRSAALLHRYEK